MPQVGQAPDLACPGSPHRSPGKEVVPPALCQLERWSDLPKVTQLWGATAESTPLSLRSWVLLGAWLRGSFVTPGRARQGALGVPRVESVPSVGPSSRLTCHIQQPV